MINGVGVQTTSGGSKNFQKKSPPVYLALENSRTEMGRKPEAGSKQLKSKLGISWRQAGRKNSASKRQERSNGDASMQQEGSKKAASTQKISRRISAGNQQG